MKLELPGGVEAKSRVSIGSYGARGKYPFRLNTYPNDIGPVAGFNALVADHAPVIFQVAGVSQFFNVVVQIGPREFQRVPSKQVCFHKGNNTILLAIS